LGYVFFFFEFHLGHHLILAARDFRSIFLSRWRGSGFFLLFVGVGVLHWWIFFIFDFGHKLFFLMAVLFA
jgi:hypothetical protein